MLAQFSAQNAVVFSPSFYMALPSTSSIRPLTFLAVPHRPPSAPHHHLRPCGLRALLCSHALDLHSSSIVHDRRSLFCPHTVVRCRGRRSTPPQLDAAMVPQQLQASRYIRRHRSHSISNHTSCIFYRNSAPCRQRLAHRLRSARCRRRCRRQRQRSRSPGSTRTNRSIRSSACFWLRRLTTRE